MSNDSGITIGYSSSSISNAITIGYNATALGNRGIAIGHKAISKNDDQVIIGNIDLNELEKRVSQLEQIVKDQEEIINALWYHPGMPGSIEAKDDYNDNIQQL